MDAQEPAACMGVVAPCIFEQDAQKAGLWVNIGAIKTIPISYEYLEGQGTPFQKIKGINCIQ